MSTFDPSEHTVAQVREYLSDADDDERERVLAAERDGKARASLVGDEPAAQEPAADAPADEGRFDAVASAEADLDELIGDQKVLPRRREHARVLHVADTAAAGRPVPVGERARAALRLGEP